MQIYSILGSFTSDSISIGDTTIYKTGSEDGYLARINIEGKTSMLYHFNGFVYDYEGEDNRYHTKMVETGGYTRVYEHDDKITFYVDCKDSLTLNGKTLKATSGSITNSIATLVISLSKDSIQAIKDINVVPTTTKLNSVYPNPFNPTTTISFSLPKTENVNVSVYNIKGQKVTTLFDNTAKAGHTSMQFNASRYASGVYFVRMVTAGGNVQSKKMVLIK